MEDIDQFAGTWRNVQWKPLDEDRYQYLFEEGGALLIGLDNEKGHFYTAVWLDQNHQFHSISHFIISGLPTPGGAARLVTQAELGGKVCAISLSIDPVSADHLIGTIELPELDTVEGPVGTFTAEANSGERTIDATRREESHAV